MFSLSRIYDGFSLSANAYFLFGFSALLNHLCLEIFLLVELSESFCGDACPGSLFIFVIKLLRQNLNIVVFFLQSKLDMVNGELHPHRSRARSLSRFRFLPLPRLAFLFALLWAARVFSPRLSRIPFNFYHRWWLSLQSCHWDTLAWTWSEKREVNNEFWKEEELLGCRAELWLGRPWWAPKCGLLRSTGTPCYPAPSFASLFPLEILICLIS